MLWFFCFLHNTPNNTKYIHRCVPPAPSPLRPAETWNLGFRGGFRGLWNLGGKEVSGFQNYRPPVRRPGLRPHGLTKHTDTRKRTQSTDTHREWQKATRAHTRHAPRRPRESYRVAPTSRGKPLAVWEAAAYRGDPGPVGACTDTNA